ncbi:MAG: CsgG/HfaB family protein [Pseudomonadales bacterium]
MRTRYGLELLAAAGLALFVWGPDAAALENPFGKKAGTEIESASGIGPIAACQGQRRASIAISRFDNSVRNADFYRAGVGDGMADQLTTALVSTGCFKVVDRQNLKGVMDELGLQNSGAVDSSTASRVGKLVGADIIVTAAITEFEDGTSGSSARGGGGAFGRIGGIIGGIAGATKKAQMAVDLRITDVQTSEILGATAVRGEATDVEAGALLGAVVPGAGGIGALESWENTPRGAALRQVIEGAVVAIREMVPEAYYRHEVGRFASAPTAMDRAPGPAAASGGGDGVNKVLQKAQRTLTELGIYNGAADGLMGPQTRAAISEFQTQVGLPATGELDLQTVQQLNSFTD